MELATILGLISAGTQLLQSLGPLIADAKSVLSSDDQAKVDSALAELIAANEPLYQQAQTKLRVVMFDWDDFPVILGQGTVHDLRDGDEGTPRLYGLKSVSKSACWAMHKKPEQTTRQIGFHRLRPR